MQALPEDPLRHRYKLLVSPSIFRADEEPRYFHSWWRAFAAAMWTVLDNPHSEALILRRRGEGWERMEKWKVRTSILFFNLAPLLLVVLLVIFIVRC